MKKLFFLAAFMHISICINAQNDDAAQPKALDSLLVNIDQSLVTSGIIYERTVQLANLYNFNTKGYANTANFDYFRQCLLEMYRASNGKKFISLDDLEGKINNSPTDNTVTIGILNTQFNVLNFNEDEPLKGGLILDTVARKFIQIPDVTPFYMMHNTVIAPLKEAIDGKDITYKFSNEFFFNNGEKTIITLTVDFGNGTKKDIITNGTFNEQDITIQYDKAGNKKLIFTVVYNDGSTMFTNAEIYFRNTNLSPSSYVSCAQSNNDQLRQDFINVPADIDFSGYTVGDPKIKSKITYRIYYSTKDGNTQKLIKKPIIVIDGFDPGDKRKIEDCDCEIDATCASKHKDSNGNFDPESHRSITDMMVYYENSTKRELLPVLRSLGYDVIIVNFPNYTTTNLNNGQSVAIDGGAYYIESNAMSVIKLIKNIRGQLVTNGSTNQIAVIAPSMAGQISRYALSYMEKKFQETNNNDWKHNVYLWVSIDSPHLGANIPLGDQALLGLAKNSSAAAGDFYRKQLSSPAAQEQLIEFHREKVVPNPLYPQFSSNPLTTDYHIAEPSMLNGQTTSSGLSMDRGNSMFQEHYNRQSNNGITGSNGWPMNLRKIAVVNGSLTGSKKTQAINGEPLPTFAKDGEKVLNIRGFQRVHINLPFGSITFYVHIASLESHFMPKTGETKRISRFKKHWDDKTTNVTNINGRGVMDNVPGGFFDSQGQIAGPALAQNVVPGNNQFNSYNDFGLTNFIFNLSQSLGGDRWYLLKLNPIHSFIPTFSAIAHLEPNQNWNNPLNYNLACPTDRKTPFDSYFGGDKNTQHTSFTKESVEWLLKELDGNPQEPYFPIQNDALTGPSNVCKNANAVFSFLDVCQLPSGVMTWSVEGNLSLGSFTDYTVTVAGTSDVLSTGKIIATFHNGVRYEKTISIGKPKVTSHSINGGYDNVSVGASNTFSVSAEGANQYYWFINTISTDCSCVTNSEGLTICPPNVTFPKFSESNATTFTSTSPSAVVNWGNCKGSYVVNCRAVNSCGTTDIGYKIVNVYNSTGGGNDPCEPTLQTHPNPVTDSGMTINLIPAPGNPCDDNVGEKINNIKIYDLYGNQVFSGSYNTDALNISGLNLGHGNYIINVFTSKGYVKREIIVVE